MLGFGFVGMLLSGQANAATATANLSVTATVSASCSISTTALGFGAYDPVATNAASPLDGTGTVIVTCTNGAAAAVTLGQGANAAAGSTDTAPVRRMKNAGGVFLSYSLYQDSAHTTVWGNTAGTSVAQTGTGTASSVTVYGRVPAAQNVASGSYSDTVVATVTF
ncbi:MAG: spore coat U domain-containing protein [Myxococcales bacterium]